MSTSFHLLWLLGAAGLVAAACTDVLGNDFEVVPPTSSAGGGATGGTAGASSGGGSGGTAASGGAGGSGGSLPCELGAIGACGAGMKCGVTDLTTGETGCVEAGDSPVWAACVQDEDCEDGTFCDQLTRICKPYCQDALSDCPQGGLCEQAWVVFGSEPIPNVQLCIANCHPISAQPCDSSAGSVTCGVVSSSEGIQLDCLKGGGSGAHGFCNGASAGSFTTECSLGHDCWSVGGMQQECLKWCTPPDNSQNQCDTGDVCNAPGVTIEHQSVIYGICN